MTMPLWVCIDIETVGRAGAADLIERDEPDLDAIKLDGRLKDPDKIAADLAAKRDATVADAARKLALARRVDVIGPVAGERAA